MTLPCLQWRSSIMLPWIMNLGWHHRIKTKCTFNNTRKGISTNTRWAKGIIRLHDRATGEGIYLPLKEPLCSTLLYQKERWQAMTCTRLPTTQWMDHQELLPPATNLWTHCTSSECENIHQSQCQMGVQQYMHQGGRQIQSGIYHKSRAVWTNCNVLWTDEFSSNLLNNDECNFCPRNSWRMADCLHGWHTHCHPRWPKVPWRMHPLHAGETMPAWPIPQTRNMHLWATMNGVSRSCPRKWDSTNGSS